jgi:hypothetical protein
MQRALMDGSVGALLFVPSCARISCHIDVEKVGGKDSPLIRSTGPLTTQHCFCLRLTLLNRITQMRKYLVLESRPLAH